ncbi:NAD(P)/FAD-dependent oxidoreductase [Tropicimonas sp. S265A]|uniref:NAD(P)/FAD-dependent oxidoreductase n=1 Tax=Tropicimonas sp. S265A TaxID=3415134 RepID=UPI003C7A6DDA
MAEVTVLGAGIFGLSVAWACTLRGARVRVIDPGGVGSGASGGIVGALAPHTPENWNPKKQLQLESLLLAEAWWTRIAEETGQDPGYARLGRVQAIADARALDLARARATGAGALWQGRARWHVVPDRDFAGWLAPTPTGFAIHDTLSARLHPRRACAAMATALTARGAEVVRRGAVQGAVVEATGVDGLLELSSAFSAQVGNGVKGQGAVLDFDARALPQLFLDGLHIVPHTDGTVAIGSTSERSYETPDTTDAQLDALLDKARQAVPALRHAAVLTRWAGVRPRARSRAPMLGVHPLRTDRFIANGGFKIGFGIAPAAAEMMADLILEGDDRIPEDFRPEASLPKVPAP